MFDQSALPYLKWCSRGSLVASLYSCVLPSLSVYSCCAVIFYYTSDAMNKEKSLMHARTRIAIITDTMRVP